MMRGMKVPPAIAVGAAALAVVLAGVAAIVTLTRSAPEPALGVDDGTASAADLVAARSVTVTPATGGVTFATAVPALGVRAGDTVLAIGGHAVASHDDVLLALTELAVGPVSTSVYVELRRGDAQVLVRRRITGDVHGEWLAVHAPPAPPPAPPTPSTGLLDPFADPFAAPPPPADDPVADAIRAGVRKLDDTHYSIDRKVMEKLLADPMAMAKGARIVPAMANGKPSGFKLYAIRPYSIYAALGLANGDTLARINGSDLTSADKALEIYTKLRDAKTLVVELVRRGKPLTQTYVIH